MTRPELGSRYSPWGLVLDIENELEEKTSIVTVLNISLYGRDAVLQTRKPRVRFPIMSLDIFQFI
jgi:hypothetical protein